MRKLKFLILYREKTIKVRNFSSYVKEYIPLKFEHNEKMDMDKKNKKRVIVLKIIQKWYKTSTEIYETTNGLAIYTIVMVSKSSSI